MTSSAKIQESITTFLSDYANHTVQEIKAHLQQSELNDYTEGQFAGSINTLLRNGTIRKIDRGLYALKTRSEDMKKCFVVSPIGEDGSETRANADKVYRHIIKPACEACEFSPIRVDQLNDANSITQTIIEQLETADLVIADMTSHNPNVFYEMGYRARTKKPMIHLKQRGEAIPFDVNTIRTLEYDLTDIDSVEEVRERLKKTIESFSYPDIVDSATEEDSSENSSASIIPILYQILDTMGELRSEVRNLTSDTISTVIKSFQSVQPQVSPDTALQMQLLNGLMQNPEKFVSLIELSEKFTSKGRK